MLLEWPAYSSDYPPSRASFANTRSASTWLSCARSIPPCLDRDPSNLAKLVPPGFVFGVVLPAVVGELTPGAAFDEALGTSLEVAKAVEARCLLSQRRQGCGPPGRTAPPRRCLRPAPSRRRGDWLGAAWNLGARRRDRHRTEPRGASGARRRSGGFPTGPIAYTRLRALGQSSTISAAAIERIADQVRGRREVFVVVEGARDALRIKGGLKAVLAQRKSPNAGGLVVRPAPSALVAEDEEQ